MGRDIKQIIGYSALLVLNRSQFVADKVYHKGLLCYEKDTSRFKIGDNNTKWGDLPYLDKNNLVVSDSKPSFRAGLHVGTLWLYTGPPSSLYVIKEVGASTIEYFEIEGQRVIDMGGSALPVNPSLVYNLGDIFVNTNNVGAISFYVYDDSPYYITVDKNPIASKLLTGFKVKITGDADGVTGVIYGNEGAEDGDEVTLEIALAESGVTEGTYCKVTVDERGIVTTGYATIDISDVDGLGDALSDLGDDIGDVEEALEALETKYADVIYRTSQVFGLSDKTVVVNVDTGVETFSGGVVNIPINTLSDSVNASILLNQVVVGRMILDKLGSLGLVTGVDDVNDYAICKVLTPEYKKASRTFSSGWEANLCVGGFLGRFRFASNNNSLKFDGYNIDTSSVLVWESFTVDVNGSIVEMTSRDINPVEFSVEVEDFIELFTDPSTFSSIADDDFLLFINSASGSRRATINVGGGVPVYVQKRFKAGGSVQSNGSQNTFNAETDIVYSLIELQNYLSVYQSRPRGSVQNAFESQTYYEIAELEVDEVPDGVVEGEVFEILGISPRSRKAKVTLTNVTGSPVVASLVEGNGGMYYNDINGMVLKLVSLTGVGEGGTILINQTSEVYGKTLAHIEDNIPAGQVLHTGDIVAVIHDEEHEGETWVYACVNPGAATLRSRWVAQYMINEASDVVVDGITIGQDGDGKIYVKDASIVAAKLGISAVTTEKIANKAVTTGKIAAKAVTTEKIDDEAVTTDKIGSEAVTDGKINKEAIAAFVEGTVFDNSITKKGYVSWLKQLYDNAMINYENILKLAKIWVVNGNLNGVSGNHVLFYTGEIDIKDPVTDTAIFNVLSVIETIRPESGGDREFELGIDEDIWEDFVAGGLYRVDVKGSSNRQYIIESCYGTKLVYKVNMPSKDAFGTNTYGLIVQCEYNEQTKTLHCIVDDNTPSNYVRENDFVVISPDSFPFS